jgi:hypothetical protein
MDSTAMQQMMQSPLMQQLLNNPEMLRSMLQMNPAVREVSETAVPAGQCIHLLATERGKVELQVAAIRGDCDASSNVSEQGASLMCTAIAELS